MVPKTMACLVEKPTLAAPIELLLLADDTVEVPLAASSTVLMVAGRVVLFANPAASRHGTRSGWTVRYEITVAV